MIRTLKNELLFLSFDNATVNILDMNIEIHRAVSFDSIAHFAVILKSGTIGRLELSVAALHRRRKQNRESLKQSLWLRSLQRR